MNASPSAALSLCLEETPCALCGGARRQPVAQGRDFEYETCRERFTFVACLDCGHVYLNPRPTLACAPLIYPKNYYTLAEGPPKGGLKILQKLKERILIKRLRPLLDPLPPASRVLEIGCGDGRLLLAIKKCRPDLQVAGLDLQISSYHREQMRSLGIEVLETPLESAEVPWECDLAIMNQIVEHLWDLAGGLRKLFNLLKPGGQVSLTTPNLDGYDRFLFKRGFWGGYYYPRHLNLFSQASLTRLLQNHDFKVIEHKNLVAPLIWKGSLLSCMKAGRIFLHRLMRDNNLPLLGFFTTLDLAARLLGLSTSNQQMIAQKPGRVAAAA